jgi:hypothetical protein
MERKRSARNNSWVRVIYASGGEGGIRTHGEVAPTAVFKTAALNHSATSPTPKPKFLLHLAHASYRQRVGLSIASYLLKCQEREIGFTCSWGWKSFKLLCGGMPAAAVLHAATYPPLITMLRNKGAEYGEYIGFKPRILLHPAAAAPGRVGQGEIFWAIAGIGAHPFGEGDFLLCGQVAGLSIAANKEREPRAGQVGEDAAVPKRGAFRARRQVSAGTCSGVAKAHRHQRNFCGIIERVAGKPCPFPQPFAACVIPRHTAGVHPRSWRLADDE